MGASEGHYDSMVIVLGLGNPRVPTVGLLFVCTVRPLLVDSILFSEIRPILYITRAYYECSNALEKDNWPDTKAFPQHAYARRIIKESRSSGPTQDESRTITG